MVGHDVEAAFVDERITLSISQVIFRCATSSKRFVIPGHRFIEKTRS